MQAQNTTFGVNTVAFKSLVFVMGMLAAVAIAFLTVPLDRSNPETKLIGALPADVVVIAPHERFSGALLEANLNFPSAKAATISAVTGHFERFWEQNLQIMGASSSRVISSETTRFLEQNTWLPGSSTAVPVESSQRVFGPGEGLHQYRDTTGYVANEVQRVIGPGEGIEYYRDMTSYNLGDRQRVIGPGEGIKTLERTTSDNADVSLRIIGPGEGLKSIR